MVCDVSTKENVDSIFKTADEKLGSIDIFFANAGFPYYETMDYVNWERIEDIFKVNVFSPIYTYQNTSNISVASKVRWQSRFPQSASSQCQATRFTAQANLRCKASNKVFATSFPKRRAHLPLSDSHRHGLLQKAVEGQEGKVIRERPFPVQKPQHVAKCMVRGLEHKRKFVNPSKLFTFAQFLFAICPPIKWVYLKLEKTSWTGSRLKRQANKYTMRGE